MRYGFVKETLERLLKAGTFSLEDRVLVVAGSDAEQQLFQDLGWQHVTISNLDERMTGESFAPYEWSFQDAQHLTFPDASYDVAFVSDGLHHCDSPHRALLEMYRVARKGVIVFESRDSALMRVANRLGLTPSYELEAVVGNDYTHGGVNNSEIPNYIYRWTEREFIKTIRSYDPVGEQGFAFFYGLNLPYSQSQMKKSRVKYFVIRLVDPLLKMGTKLVKRQCNSFCMVAVKPTLPADLWPWLVLQDDVVRFNRAYAEKVYKTSD